MSTLYIRIPSKAIADSTPHWLELACPFAFVTHGNEIDREGALSLPGLAELMAKAQRVLVLLAASDVTLLRVEVPPLSAARLKAALPNLIEDRILADPAECIVVADASTGRSRTVAVAQRVWLELLIKTLNEFGARRIAILPAQLCLPVQTNHSGHTESGRVTAAINDQGACIDITLRLSDREGIGLALNTIAGETNAIEVIRTLSAIVPVAPITLYVAQTAVGVYQDVVSHATHGLNRSISVAADNWPLWISGAQEAKLDLLAGSGAKSGHALDWRPWRWPLALGALVFLMNIFAVNIDWWRMKSEAGTLRASLIQIYKSAYPNETVIIDPILQMQQKIAGAKHDAGQAAPDDFTALVAAFGDAWSKAALSSPVGKPVEIAGLQYLERGLTVRFKPALSSAAGSDAGVPTEQVKALLATRGLSLEVAPKESSSVVWRIRSAK